MKKRIKSVGGVLVSVMLLAGLMGCGRSDESYSNDSSSYKASSERGDMSASYGQNGEPVIYAGNANDEAFAVEVKGIENDQMQERKVILNEYFLIEATDFDKDKANILSKMNESGGYIEQSESYGNGINETGSRKHARLVIRIPKAKYDKFISGVVEGFHVVRQNSNSNDVTHQFYDTEARVKTLEIQEERLLEILKKSGEIKDIIEIEKELQRVRYQIESNTTTLKRLENLVSFTTITIELNEVYEVTEIIEKPKTLGERISRTFKNSIEDVNRILKALLVGVIGSIPYLIIYVPIIGVLIIIYRRVKRKSKRDEIKGNSKNEISENNEK